MTRRVAPVVVALFVMAGCADPPRQGSLEPGFEPQFQSFANSAWSEPVHLPAPINSAFRELGGAQPTPDGLSLYFASDRPGGYGGVDIWIAHRDCRDCPWGAPLNAGPVLNSSGSDASVMFTPDGLTMFFSGGERPGGAGGNDVYVAHRTDPNDDFAWSAPINVGPGVNTPAHEGAPAYVPAMSGSGANLYFERNGDFYQTRVTRTGQVTAPVTLFELSHPTANDLDITVRADGRELVFMSNRPGGMGQIDLWVSTRRSLHDAWSAPVTLGAPVNTPFADLSPSLSWDGRTLYFSAANSGRPGLGVTDIWVSTRTPNGF